MFKNKYFLDVVSPEHRIFSGMVIKIQITGTEGELGVLYGHTPLLTGIKPGMINITNEHNKKNFIYLSGGILEVYCNTVIVLADTAIRGDDIDEQRAIQAKLQAEKYIKEHFNDKDNNYVRSLADLSKAIAKLQVIDLIKKYKASIN